MVRTYVETSVTASVLSLAMRIFLEIGWEAFRGIPCMTRKEMLSHGLSITLKSILKALKRADFFSGLPAAVKKKIEKYLTRAAKFVNDNLM